MKKLFKITTILALVLVLLSGCVSRRATNEGYLLYRSSPVGVELEYPNFWEYSDDKEGRTVAFAAPNEGYADEYRENVTIVSIKTGSEDLSFDNYVMEYIQQLPSTIQGYNKLSEKELTVGQNRAYCIVYEGTTQEGNLRLNQTFIQSGEYTYIYSYIAEPASYEYYLTNAQTMLETFKPLRK